MPHTQGPWTVAGEEGFVVGGEGDAPNADFVSLTYITAPACATNYLPAAGEREANARLMAAAPDLLEACKAVLEQFDSGALVRNTDSDGLSDWALRAVKPLKALADMKAAIAKAEGTA